MTSKKFIFRILFLALIFSLSGCGENRKPEANSAALDSLRNSLLKQERLNDSLQLIIQKEDSQANFPIYFGRGFDTIENPEEFISNSLKAHPELIPMKAVLGGTMEFRQIQVLTEDWVLAVYDDGHVEGKAIFNYKLSPQGQLEFKPVLKSQQ